LNGFKVQGTVESTSESEIVIGIDTYHDNDLNSSEISNITSQLNTTFGLQQIVYLTEKFSSENLAGIDVLVILAPTLPFDLETEDDAVEEFIKKGKSVFAATGFRNQIREPLNDLLDVFGLNFNFTKSITSETSLELDFTSPITPLTKGVVQVAIPNGLGISFNESKLESYQSPAIHHYNPILLENLNERPSENNTLISTLEFENGARIFASGSADMFNNSYIEPLANDTSVLIDNTAFFLNSIRWLGRETGLMTFYGPWVDLDGQSITMGVFINGNVSLLDSQNQSLSQAQLVIVLERTGSILSSSNMQLDFNNTSSYHGSVSTEGLSYGYCDIVFIATRVGYITLEQRAGRIYLDPPFPTPIPPDLALWGLLLASIVIFISSVLSVYQNLGKKEEV
jgi:hypothetical protein